MSPQAKHISREVLPLDGPWYLELDPADVGKKQKWGEARIVRGAEVLVPACWNQYYPGYEGVAWYFKSFEAASLEPGDQAFLKFHAVDYYAEVWFDGKLVGCHEGGHTPFLLDVTGAWGSGAEHYVAVRVVDPPVQTGESVGGYAHTEIPAGMQPFQFNYGGIWQSVELIRSGPVFLSDLYVEPFPHQAEVLVHMTFRTSSRQRVRYRLDLLEQDRRFVASVSSICDGVDGTKEDRVRLRIPEPRWWNDDNPLLYIVRCVANIGDVLSDVHEQRFGLRHLELTRDGFLLNGRQVYLCGVSDLQFYPITLAAPQNEGTVRRQLQELKHTGYNLICFKGRPPVPWLLDLCDELGILVLEQPAIGCIQESAHMEQRCRSEVHEMVLRDRNHPSVVIWGILNEPCAPHAPPSEALDVGGAAGALVPDLARLARRTDSSRLVLTGSSGPEDGCWVHAYLNPAQEEPERYYYHRIDIVPPVSTDECATYLSAGRDELCVFSSGAGGSSLEDLSESVAAYGGPDVQYEDLVLHREFEVQLRRGFKDLKLKKLFGSLADLARRTQDWHGRSLARALLALRANPASAAACVGYLADFGYEISGGLTDVWGRPKAVMDHLRGATQPVQVQIFLQHDQCYVGQQVELFVVLLNDIRRQGSFPLTVRIDNRFKQQVFHEELEVALTGDRVQRLYSARIRLEKYALGEHTVAAQLGEVARSTESFGLHAPPPPLEGVNVVDPDKTLAPRMAEAEGGTGFLVAPLKSDESLAAAWEQIEPHVRAGQRALFLSLPVDSEEVGTGRDWGAEYRWDSQVFGEPLYFARTGGGPGPYFHYIPRHPIFTGLPQKCLANETYAHVLPELVLRGEGVKILAGAFRLPLPPYPHLRHLQHAGESWWGGSLLSMRCGEGEVLVTTFRVHEGLGHPIADRLLSNFVLYLAGQLV